MIAVTLKMVFGGCTAYIHACSTSNKFSNHIVVVVVVGFEANCPLVGLGPIGDVPSVGSLFMGF